MRIVLHHPNYIYGEPDSGPSIRGLKIGVMTGLTFTSQIRLYDWLRVRNRCPHSIAVLYPRIDPYVLFGQMRTPVRITKGVTTVWQSLEEVDGKGSEHDTVPWESIALSTWTRQMSR